MKKNYLILILLIFNLTYSQDTRLFENNWYLRNVIVDGVSNYPPNGNMYLYFTNSGYFYTYACNTMAAQVTFENNNTNFSATNFAYTLDFCFNQPAEDYQYIYFPFFDFDNDPTSLNSFTYNITEVSNERTLIINSMFNKQAIYSNVELSNNSFKKLNVLVIPNPSASQVEISLNNNLDENITAEFYNEIGQLCKTVDLHDNKTAVEISNLVNGVYCIKIKTSNSTTTTKLIKI